MQKNNSPTAYRKELRERILAASMEEFRKHGVRAVKMDDIASRLGISKRTLYEIYSNKETLLLEGMKMYEEDIDAYMTRFVESDEHNVIETIIEFYNLQIKQ